MNSTLEAFNALEQNLKQIKEDKAKHIKEMEEVEREQKSMIESLSEHQRQLSEHAQSRKSE